MELIADKPEIEQQGVSTDEKIIFLSDPKNYPEPTRRIAIRETHMSWLFFTDDFVYKLKKPVKLDFLDFSTTEHRRKNCEEEVRLNRRLADEIYLGVVRLSLDATGKMHLNRKDGTEVDWLVKMKRLPAELMLDELVKKNKVNKDLAVKAAQRLSEFYMKSVPIQVHLRDQLIRLREEICSDCGQLMEKEFKLSAVTVHSIRSQLIRFLIKYGKLFADRLKEHRIIEAHGDLRPEHVCLTPKPVFIDCLEFNRKFRIIDIAEELSFFALECEVHGAPEIGSVFIDEYFKKSGDKIPPGLISFYKSKKACLRAKLAAWHLMERKYQDDPKWIAQSRKYLYYAQKYAGML